MGSYKHIENSIGEYIASRYTRAIEVGIGHNTTAAEILNSAGILSRATDIKTIPDSPIPVTVDDVFDPAFSLYERADVIYAIRPAIEMIPPLISLARRAGSDLIVYHLGFETYGDGGEKIDCGVMLHRYVTRSEPVKKG
ncbi:UPF0146 family protein [uncultured Methanoregula sp.]|uniref:UPF0146 family protein n=1 Tax=uncultured Methanoregula sp. TaxID=1005933 RepID=UPI002AABED63|nr:UPF0146 family protein [uncultured Methanoregula sp.]